MVRNLVLRIDYVAPQHKAFARHGEASGESRKAGGGLRSGTAPTGINGVCHIQRREGSVKAAVVRNPVLRIDSVAPQHRAFARHRGGIAGEPQSGRRLGLVGRHTRPVGNAARGGTAGAQLGVGVPAERDN